MDPCSFWGYNSRASITGGVGGGRDRFYNLYECEESKVIEWREIVRGNRVLTSFLVAWRCLPSLLRVFFSIATAPPPPCPPLLSSPFSLGTICSYRSRCLLRMEERRWDLYKKNWAGVCFIYYRLQINTDVKLQKKEKSLFLNHFCFHTGLSLSTLSYGTDKKPTGYAITGKASDILHYQSIPLPNVHSVELNASVGVQSVETVMGLRPGLLPGFVQLCRGYIIVRLPNTNLSRV